MNKLNSVEIADELKRLGFVLVVNNKHANGYEHSDLRGLVFLKMSKTGAPVYEQPFLIHPDHVASPRWEAIKALSPTQPNVRYKNTNVTGFPKVKGSDSKLAVALDISTPADLPQLLALLGHRGFGATAKLQAEIAEVEHFDAMFSSNDITDTEREALIKARIGQGEYRQALLAYWGGCAITDCTAPVLLRASHIKPWREATASERLDPYNGVLLTPNLDLAFDQGFITFDDQGLIRLSPELDTDSASALHLHPHLRLRQIEPRHCSYLAWHRENLFRK
jgi:hypothetical protein